MHFFHFFLRQHFEFKLFITKFWKSVIHSLPYSSCFKRWSLAHRWEKYLSKRSLFKDTSSWCDKPVILTDWLEQKYSSNRSSSQSCSSIECSNIQKFTAMQQTYSKFKREHPSWNVYLIKLQWNLPKPHFDMGALFSCKFSEFLGAGFYRTLSWIFFKIFSKSSNGKATVRPQVNTAGRRISSQK